MCFKNKSNLCTNPLIHWFLAKSQFWYGTFNAILNTVKCTLSVLFFQVCCKMVAVKFYLWILQNVITYAYIILVSSFYKSFLLVCTSWKSNDLNAYTHRAANSDLLSQISNMNFKTYFCIFSWTKQIKIKTFCTSHWLKFRLERIFQPMRALEFITGHMVYNLAYT